MNLKKATTGRKGKTATRPTSYFSRPVVASLIVIVVVIAALIQSNVRGDNLMRFLEKSTRTMLSRFFSTTTTTAKSTANNLKNGEIMASFYDFKVNDLNNKPYDLNQLKGKVVLIVNVASQCGFTRQYTGLQSLYDEYKDKGLVILGFPCNQFGGQEPGTAEEIHSFCSRTYGVSFPIMSKVEVNGQNADPLYEWMKAQKTNLFMATIKWNFEKFLIDKKGTVRDRYASTTTPESLKSTIDKLLAE